MTKRETISDFDPNYIPAFITQKDDFVEDPDDGNGLIINNNVYIPEEIMILILSNIDACELLQYSLVCHKWNRLIKSYALWSLKYKNKYNQKVKKLPWYVYYCILSTHYFDNNLLKNGNGQNKFEHWHFVSNGGDQCCIEDVPNGADPLPLDVADFNGYTSCFATSFGDCHKKQIIDLGTNRLFHYILNHYKPHIHVSEWTAGRFDCGSYYVLRCGFLGENISARFVKPCAIQEVLQWEGRTWEKMEIIITSYPEELEALVFENIGRDTQFWKGHFGSKMAGGVLKFVSDTIEPLEEDEKGNFISRKFSVIDYTCNGLSGAEKTQLSHFMIYNNGRYLGHENEELFMPEESEDE